MKCFANVSNHSSEKWSEKQLLAAEKICGSENVKDYQFPNIPPDASAEEVSSMAKDYAESVIEDGCNAALVAGPFGFALGVARRLADKGIAVYDACSERNTSETVLPDGSTRKVVKFDFVQFRRVL